MSYVYDIVLNFNDQLYDFYEWKRDDLIYHIKRIKLFLVNSKIFNDLYDNVVTFNDDFLLSIFNKCEYITNRKIATIPYAFLVTDSFRVVGLLLDNKGKVIKYSSLLLDEEEEILELARKLQDGTIAYHIIEKRIKNDMWTREEIKMIQYIRNDINLAYKIKNTSKLKYLYYEFFNKHSDNIDLIYQELLTETNKNINRKVYDLYNLIKLSYNGKNV